LYACGNSIVIRNIHNPAIAELYDQHAHQTTVAKYAPSGFYIASADVSGTVRIWDTINKEHILKSEYQVLGGPVLDLDWSDDSKRIVVGGDGREKYGHAFFFDGGASCGEITNHTKLINTVSIKQTRPYRVATGSEDFAVNWFEGPPFKYKKRMTTHTRFVNSTRFSPNGNVLASAGSDKLIVLYDGKTGEQTATLSGHTGGVYSVSWSPDSNQLLSASADRTCKIWDVATGQVITTFNFGKGVDDQQLGSLWQGNYLLSVNLAGHISYLDPASGKPSRVLKGHNKFITALAVDRQKRAIYSGSYDSVVTRWNIDGGDNEIVGGAAPKNQIAGLSVDGNSLFAGAFDDSLSIGNTGTDNFDSSTGVDAPVVDVDSAAGVKVAATLKSVFLVKGGNTSQVAAAYGPSSVAISPDGNEVAVGGEDNKIHIYTVAGNNLNETKTLEQHRGGVTAVKYSPDGRHIASGSKDRNVYVWDRATGAVVADRWGFHSSTVTSVAWNPDSARVASGGLDQNIFVWNLNAQATKIEVRGAHRGGVNAVEWLDANTLFSAGADCSVKSWNVQ